MSSLVAASIFAASAGVGSVATLASIGRDREVAAMTGLATVFCIAGAVWNASDVYEMEDQQRAESFMGAFHKAHDGEYPAQAVYTTESGKTLQVDAPTPNNKLK